MSVRYKSGESGKVAARGVFCSCSACGANLRHGVNAATPCPHGCGDDSHYSRTIGLIERDRVVEWSCPDCGRTVAREAVTS